MAWVKTADRQPAESGTYLTIEYQKDWYFKGEDRFRIYPLDYSKRHNAWNANDVSDDCGFAFENIEWWYEGDDFLPEEIQGKKTNMWRKSDCHS